MNKLFLISVLVLSGCGMTNKEIIEEVKFCEYHGMRAHLNIDWVMDHVVSVMCLPKYETLTVNQGKEHE